MGQIWLVVTATEYELPPKVRHRTMRYIASIGPRVWWRKVLSRSSWQKRCNVLFIMADQFRRDALYHVGGVGQTKALDALAAEGISFRRAITNSPECIPARFALSSGLYPHQTEVWRNAAITLSPQAWSWTRALAATGYRTSIFGKTHFHESAHASGDLRDGLALMHGYGLLDVDEIAGPRASAWVKSAMTDRWEERGLLIEYRRDFEDRFARNPWIARPSPLGLDQYYDTYVGRRALEYLSSYDRPEPWFCWVSFAGPHEPWDAPVPYNHMHAAASMRDAIPRLDNWESTKGLLGDLFHTPSHAAPSDRNDVAAMRANYAGNVTLIDDQIGAIIDHLKTNSSYDNTLILFTSDHGEMNGDHGLIYKGNFLSSAVDIPFIVRPPHSLGTPFTSFDRIPTQATDALVELIDAGATILDYIGASLPSFSNSRSVRPLLEGRSVSHRDHVVSEFGKHTMIATQGWKCEFDSCDEPVLLFNRTKDPSEQHNLVNDRRHSETLQHMKGILASHRLATSKQYKITTPDTL